VSTLTQIMDAMAAQLEDEIGPLIENLQVQGRLIPSPTPPSIDIYPGDPFQDLLTFGAQNELFFTVRARVHTADNEAGQELLLSMMDPESATSVAQAIRSDRKLGNTVSQATVVEGPSAFGVFTDAGGEGSLLGCTWRVRVLM